MDKEKHAEMKLALMKDEVRKLLSLKPKYHPFVRPSCTCEPSARDWWYNPFDGWTNCKTCEGSFKGKK
jgi:hypothetical protein